MIFSLRFLIVAIVIIALSSENLWSSEQFFQQGQVAYDAADYQRADEIWQQGAEAGDQECMFALGALAFERPDDYLDGLVESSEWFLKAAQLGHMDAQYNLGNAYRNGRGVKQDDAQAVYWWQRAAAQGMPNAAYNLGVQYLYGRGVPQDYDQALEKFKFAAVRGHSGARKILLAWNMEIPALVVTPKIDKDETATTVARVTPMPIQQDQSTDNQDTPLAVTQESVVTEPKPVVAETGPVEIDLSGKTTEVIAMEETADRAEQIIEKEATVASEPEQETVVNVLSSFEISESLILDISPSRYTLQLTVMSKPGQVDDFISLYQLSGDMYRYRFSRNAKTLYGLSMGNFISRENAVTFRDQLEHNMASKPGWQTPWLRSFTEVQKLIRLVQEPEQF